MTHDRLWSPLVKTLVPYVPGEQPKVDNLVKLNTNENPYAPSPKVREAILNTLASQGETLRLYPDPDATQLVHAIAKYHGLAEGNVFVGNGSDEVLAHIFMAFFKQAKSILFPDITYSFYPVYSQLYEVQYEQIPLADDFSIDVAQYHKANGGIIFANPNAPTGVLLPLAKLRQLLQHNPDSVVVVDEAYIDFGGETAIGLIEEFAQLVVCQTLSKSRALAGLRVGVAFAQPQLIDALNRVKNSFNSYPLDQLAIAGAVASYGDDAYFKAQCRSIVDNREQLVAAMQKLQFHTLPSAANFIFTRHERADALELAAYLRSQGVIVRHFAKARIAQYLRITVGSAAQNARLLACLTQFLTANG